MAWWLWQVTESTISCMMASNMTLISDGHFGFLSSYFVCEYLSPLSLLISVMYPYNQTSNGNEDCTLSASVFCLTS
jgi:hypothetical protein